MRSTGKDKEQKPRRKPGRVPTACAECRRLKLRCDRNVPCAKCVSRGCGAICPDGALTPGKGNKMILANTEELHDRIDQYSSRIHELEDSLQALQAQISHEPHPLLRKDVIQTQCIPSTSNISSTNPVPVAVVAPRINDSTMSAPSPTSPHIPNIPNSFGSLSIGNDGQSKFVGPTARIELFTQEPLHPGSIPSRLSNELMQLIAPDAQILATSFGPEILSLLPPVSEAMQLCEFYSQYGTVLYFPVAYDELFDHILKDIYHAKTLEDIKYPEKLALLFSVFAIASYLDTTDPSADFKSMEYCRLAKICLRLSCRENTLTYLHTLIHLAEYHHFRGPNSSETPPDYVHQALRISLQMGLHFHWSRWNLPKELGQKRTRIFARLIVVDTIINIFNGRPPLVSLAFVDQAILKDPDINMGAVDGENHETLLDFHSWFFQYCLLMRDVMTAALGSPSPSYASILNFDRKIRDFVVPRYWRLHCLSETSIPATDTYIIRSIVMGLKECLLVALHRPYFIQALQDSPEDLHKHAYIPSVVATYRSAWRMLKALRFSWGVYPQMISRISFTWSHALSAAVVMCQLATRAPNSHLASHALTELHLLVELFEEAPTSQIVRNLLDVLRCLRRTAQGSLSEDDDPRLSYFDLDRLSGRTSLNMPPNPGPSYSSPASVPLQNSILQHQSLQPAPTYVKESPTSHGPLATLSELATPAPFPNNVPLPDIVLSTSHSSLTTFPSSPNQETQSQMAHYQLSSMVMNNLHPIILQDLQDFNACKPLSNASISSYFDFPPEDTPPAHPMEEDNCDDILSQRHEKDAIPTRSNDSVYPETEASFRLDTPGSRRSSVNTSHSPIFESGTGNGGNIALDPAYHGLAEHLGFSLSCRILPGSY